MDSHEVLQRALQKTTPKAVAAELGVSLSLVYKWTEKSSADGTGSRNPLDRLLQIMELSGDHEILDWLCHHQGGHFVEDPDLGGERVESILPATQEMILHFSNLLNEISTATEDHAVSKSEAKEIRLCWDTLKAHAEAFVRACEKGDFRVARVG